MNRKILITSPHNIGDLIAKVPLIRVLKRNNPQVKIILLARSYVYPLARLIREIDEFIDFDYFFHRDRKDIVEALKALSVDVLIHILSVERAIGPDVISYAKEAGIKTRVGNIQRSKLKNYLNKKNLTHNVRQKRIIPKVHEFLWNLKALPFLGIKKTFNLEDLKELSKLEPSIKSPLDVIDPKKFNLVLHPGSKGNAKEWPKKHYRELISLIDKEEFNLIFTGSSIERERFADLDGGISTMGELNLEELMTLISQSDGVIASSTGPAHIAAVFQKRALTLFPKQEAIGASIWMPIGERAVTLTSPLICTYCTKKLTDFDSSLCQCMEAIKPEDVKEIIDGWCYESAL